MFIMCYSALWTPGFRESVTLVMRWRMTQVQIPTELFPAQHLRATRETMNFLHYYFYRWLVLMSLERSPNSCNSSHPVLPYIVFQLIVLFSQPMTLLYLFVFISFIAVCTQQMAKSVSTSWGSTSLLSAAKRSIFCDREKPFPVQYLTVKVKKECKHIFFTDKMNASGVPVRLRQSKSELKNNAWGIYSGTVSSQVHVKSLVTAVEVTLQQFCQA